MAFFKNNLIIISTLLLFFFGLIPINVYAKEINSSFFENKRIFADVSDKVCESTQYCDNIFGDPNDIDCTAYWLQWILDIIKYVAIAALLILSTFDFIKAIISNDKDALKKAGTTAAKRFIFVVILFFLPIIIDLIMRLFGAYGTCGIE